MWINMIFKCIFKCIKNFNSCNLNDKNCLNKFAYKMFPIKWLYPVFVLYFQTWPFTFSNKGSGSGSESKSPEPMKLDVDHEHLMAANGDVWCHNNGHVPLKKSINVILFVQFRWLWLHRSDQRLLVVKTIRWLGSYCYNHVRRSYFAIQLVHLYIFNLIANEFLLNDLRIFLMQNSIRVEKGEYTEISIMLK